MSAHHVEITLAQDGKLMLDELPFRAGDTVEVIILARQSKPNGREYPLRGQLIKYVEPTDPVAQADCDIGKDPVPCGVSDASENLDKYLYGVE